MRRIYLLVLLLPLACDSSPAGNLDTEVAPGDTEARDPRTPSPEAQPHEVIFRWESTSPGGVTVSYLVPGERTRGKATESRGEMVFPYLPGGWGFSAKSGADGGVVSTELWFDDRLMDRRVVSADTFHVSSGVVSEPADYFPVLDQYRYHEAVNLERTRPYVRPGLVAGGRGSGGGRLGDWRVGNSWYNLMPDSSVFELEMRQQMRNRPLILDPIFRLRSTIVISAAWETDLIGDESIVLFHKTYLGTGWSASVSYPGIADLLP
ncbi:MAG: hypothetical protein ACI80V_002912 [Rhodothermales bacterium]